MSIIEIIEIYQIAFKDGLFVTLKMCLLVWGVGISLGSILAILANRVPYPFYYLFTSFTFVLLAIPLLVILYWLHFPLQKLLGVVIDPFYTATLTLTLVNTFLTYQIVISALRSLPKQYLNVAKVLGVTKTNILRRIQFPLIMRQAIPGVLTLQVFMLQSSIFASLISVEEIFRKAQRINAIVQKPVEIYTAMAILFVVICLPLYFLAYYFSKKYSRDYSEA
jgi:ABC-type amino acid transport system permease subunit